MKEVQLTQGKVALVDDDDFERVSKYNWCYLKIGYACSRIKNKIILLHNFIMDYSKNMKIDHKDRNRLNCQKNNLRFATDQQNGSNRSKTVKNTSGYIGVYWEKRRNHWVSRITYNGKRKYLGSYEDIKEAALKYDIENKKLNGEFCGELNFSQNSNIQHECTPISKENMELRLNYRNKSGYIGVFWKKRTKRWCEKITYNKKVYHLGYFDTPEEAAKYRDKKALELLGTNAKLNFY